MHTGIFNIAGLGPFLETALPHYAEHPYYSDLFTGWQQCQETPQNSVSHEMVNDTNRSVYTALWRRKPIGPELARRWLPLARTYGDSVLSAPGTDHWSREYTDNVQRIGAELMTQLPPDDPENTARSYFDLARDFGTQDQIWAYLDTLLGPGTRRVPHRDLTIIDYWRDHSDPKLQEVLLRGLVMYLSDPGLCEQITALPDGHFLKQLQSSLIDLNLPRLTAFDGLRQLAIDVRARETNQPDGRKLAIVLGAVWDHNGALCFPFSRHTHQLGIRTLCYQAESPENAADSLAAASAKQSIDLLIINVHGRPGELVWQPHMAKTASRDRQKNLAAMLGPVSKNFSKGARILLVSCHGAAKPEAHPETSSESTACVISRIVPQAFVIGFNGKPLWRDFKGAFSLSAKGQIMISPGAGEDHPGFLKRPQVFRNGRSTKYPAWFTAKKCEHDL